MVEEVINNASKTNTGQAMAFIRHKRVPTRPISIKTTTQLTWSAREGGLNRVESESDSDCALETPSIWRNQQ